MVPECVFYDLLFINNKKIYISITLFLFQLNGFAPYSS